MRATAFVLVALAAGCDVAPPIGETTAALVAEPNILLIVADDVGIAEVGAYSSTVPGAAPSPTPVIDSLAAAGVRFNRAYANPVCSPTRATLNTGRYSVRTGVGTVIGAAAAGGELSSAENTLAESLPSTYASALIGKWHLGTTAGGDDSPRGIGGYGKHAGILGGEVTNYYVWKRYVDGADTGFSTTYATTKMVNDALSWIGMQSTPWMMTLAFNAAHDPYHKPPARLLSAATNTALAAVANCNSSNTNKRICYQAAIEAMDTEIGRLLGTVSLTNTTVIFVGDNGTPGEVMASGFDSSRGKATLYEYGLRVPLIVAGANVTATGQVNDLVNTTDLYNTIVEWSGTTSTTGTDSNSLVGYLNGGATTPRTWVYSEKFSGTTPHNGKAAVRGGTFKIIENMGSLAECYNLVTDPDELDNLMTHPSHPAACDNLYNNVMEPMH